MIYVKTAAGKEKAISRFTLERLRMLMDWQIKHQEGYDPASVTTACSVEDSKVLLPRRYEE